MKNTFVKKTIITNQKNKAGASQSANYFIYFIFGVIEILLVFRFLLKLAGANPSSNFVATVYSVTQIFIMPFEGIFRQATTKGVETAAVLEPATLISIVVYAAIAWGIMQLVSLLSGNTHE